MRRLQIRALKRSVASQNDVHAMHALLERSVKFRHKKLALLRCLQAEKMGVRVHPDLMVYCRKVAEDMSPDALLQVIAASGKPMVEVRASSAASDRTVAQSRRLAHFNNAIE